MFGNNDKPKSPEANDMLLQAFENTYKLCSTEEEADEVFDYAKLRQFFGAMQVPKMPDPLPPYIDRLVDEMGYQFKMSWSGDPAIFVRWREPRKGIHYCPQLEDIEDADGEEMIEGKNERMIELEGGEEMIEGNNERMIELEDRHEHLGECSAWEDLIQIEKEEEEMIE